MQRLSGAYKRRVQLFAFLIGIAVAIVANVDSLAIAKTLWFDQGIRAVILSQAQETVQANGQNTTGSSPEDLIKQLGSLQLPVGWPFISNAALCRGYLGFSAARCIYPAGLTAASNELFRTTIWQTLLGILITGLATMQGSPFWFGMLSKLVNMRTSTPPAGKDKSEKS